LKKDLHDVCGYLKSLIIPHTPSDFVIAEPFRHGLSNDELLKGIAAFRGFLQELYDKISVGNSYIDATKGEDSVQKCFTLVRDVAVILSTLGLYGRLETEPRNELVVNGGDLLTPLSSTKPPAINKLSNKRKAEVLEFLSDIGFYFEDLNLSENIDFSKIGTFHVIYENDDDVILGLKLMAEAKNNIKSGFQKFMTTFMRADFYPLADAVPKAHAATAREFANAQPPQIREWIIAAEKLLMDNNKCKISCFYLSNTNGDGSFSYVKRGKTICRIAMGMGGSLIDIRGNHFANEVNILPELPKHMLDVVKSGGCGACAENDPNFISCRHGGPFKFTYNGENLERCAFGGYTFSLDNADDRKLLRKWLELELEESK